MYVLAICRCRLTELNCSKHENPVQPGMDAVGNGNIDQPVFAGDRNRGLAPRLREGEQSRASAAAEDQADQFGHQCTSTASRGIRAGRLAGWTIVPTALSRRARRAGALTVAPRGENAPKTPFCQPAPIILGDDLTSPSPCWIRSPSAHRQGRSRCVACKAARRGVYPLAPSRDSRAPSRMDPLPS